MVSSEVAKKRVLQLGEPEKNIFVISSPELDAHSKDSGVTLNGKITILVLKSMEFAYFIRNI